MRLDHFIAKGLQISERSARTRIASGEIVVDGSVCRDLQSDITQYHDVRFRGVELQSAVERLYLMLNKPVGVVSATVDDQHKTVIDLIDHPDKESLHLAGRLDRSTSGLVLLTNDSEWSESLTQPEGKVAKVYLVETDRPIPEVAVSKFAEGFYFETEGVTTRPAELEILEACRARVTLHEGRYHQIKRMFHRIDGIRLWSLHRESIGDICLPEGLCPGEWRKLSV